MSSNFQRNGSQKLENEGATQSLALSLYEHSFFPMIWHLEGPLGAGKTAFVRAFLKAAGWNGIVPSPTYNLLQTYQVGHRSYVHCDFYRLTTLADLESIGFYDLQSPNTLFLIEWPEKIGFTTYDARLTLTPLETGIRLASWSFHSFA